MAPEASFRMLLLLPLFLHSAEAFSIPESHRLDPSIPTVSPHIANTSSDSCVGQCAFTLVDEISGQIGAEKAISLMRLNYNDFLRIFGNVTFFEEFCKMYHRFQHCASLCEAGYLHEMLMKSSEIVDHFCVFKFNDVRTHFACIGGVPPPTDCIRTCTPHHQAVVTLSTHFEHFAMAGDSTEAERYLAESCEYVLCSLHCDVPSIQHGCGHSAASLVVDLTSRSFSSMQRTAIDTNVVHKWPRICEDITTYRGPPKKGSVPPSEGHVIAESPRDTEFEPLSMLPPAVETTTTPSSKEPSSSAAAACSAFLLGLVCWMMAA